MPAPRRAHILAGVLGLALVALALDRKWRSGPVEAEAALTPTERGVPPEATVAKSARPLPEPAGELSEPDAVCVWLGRLPEVERVRDVFRPENAFPVPKGAEGEAEDRAVDPVEQFENSHRLEGTFRSSDAGYAIVDGHVVRVGQSVDGFRLVRVESVEAVFRCGSRSAVLRMRWAGPGNVSPRP